jgi:alcohol dehydrogenase (cytochrome c)
MKFKRAIGLSAVLGTIVVAAVTVAVDDLRWRAEILAGKMIGEYEALPFGDLLPMLVPGSRIWLKPLTDGKSVYATISNPYAAEDDVAMGAETFRADCANCHENHGAPQLGEDPLQHGASDWALYRVIRDGVAGTAMQPHELSDRAIWQTISYIRSTRRRHSAEDAGPDSAIQIQAVSPQRLVEAASEPANWLMYSGRYDGTRYSSLAEIDRSNVQRLKVDWALQLRTDELHSESTPLVIDGVMYLTVSPNRDLALDAEDGRLLWSASRPLPAKLSNCCGPHNRGFAILGDRIYRGTLDGHLIARSARNGKLIWETEVGSPAEGFSITAAPLAVKDLIITGVAGGEFGIRGYVDAYDAETGERRWRSYTIPGKGEPGNETWAGDSWQTGGGPTWMTGSYDPKLGLLYWGVGNPAPDFNGSGREGDNLYTNSVVALDVDTGKMQWFFQFTPHDLHDWDANQVPLLIDTPEKLLVTANKNGFGYVLNRETGAYKLGHEVVPQTWAEGLDANGRPVKRQNIEPSEKGTAVRPGTGGGANWWPPSYNPQTGLVYYSLLESEHIFVKSDVDFSPGREFIGSTGLRSGSSLYLPVVKAFVAGTGDLAWEYKMRRRADWPQVGGSITTAGGLVFFGEKEHFIALDAYSGQELWRINLGASIHAAPITYQSGGKQRIGIVAGRSVYSLSVP